MRKTRAALASIRFTMRKLALTLLVVAVTLAGCELAARAFIDLRGFASRQDERDAFRRRLPAEDTDDERDASAVERATASPFVLHPYFGYTFRPSAAGADPRGFHSGADAARGGDGQLVVGVFGGSVAMQIADPRAALAEALEPAARAAGYGSVVVRSYAIGGWRQPQHFFALVRFLDEIDVAILLDGFNEVIHLGDWHLARQPADYPWSAVWGALARDRSTGDTLVRAELIDLHRGARRATAAVDRTSVRRSTLAHLLWRVYAARYEQRVAALRERLASVPAENSVTSRDVAPAQIAVRRDAYLDFWRELVSYSDLICRARGRTFFHFVQPNQYDRGSKPLSAQEREEFTRQTSWFDEVTPRYARVEQMTARLRGDGVDSSFLGDVFVGTTETVYVDDCCHLNERGVAGLVAAIGERVAASRRLERTRETVAARSRS